MKIRHALPIAAVALVAGLSATRATAGEVVDLASQAEAMAASGDHAGALARMREAFLALSDAAPLAVANATYVSEEPVNYGLYSPRPDNVFAPGEPLLVYAEPVGVGWRPDGEMFHSEITTDFEVRSVEGAVLAGQKEFGRFLLDSRAKNIEYMTRISINLTGAAAGPYVLALIFNDRIDGDSTTVELPFEVR